MLTAAVAVSAQTKLVDAYPIYYSQTDGISDVGIVQDGKPLTI